MKTCHDCSNYHACAKDDHDANTCITFAPLPEAKHLTKDWRDCKDCKRKKCSNNGISSSKAQNCKLYTTYEESDHSTDAAPYQTPDPLATQVGGTHYKDYKIQPIEFILENKLGFCEGNAIKYIARHKAKNGAQDIEKAIHYLQILLKQEYGK